jgi:hypothetical protein
MTDEVAITGSETHFLMKCPDSCGTSLECIAGVCTSPCTEDASCTGFSAAAVCSAEPSAPAPGVCDVSCAVAADCALLGAGYGCVSGACRGAGPSANDGIWKPGSFLLLELRRIGEAAAGPGSECDPLLFTQALFVDRPARTLSWQSCSNSTGSDLFLLDAGEVVLTDANFADLDAAFDLLGPDNTDSCASGSGIITLDVTSEEPALFSYADANHTGCPIARLGRNRFIRDLFAFYAVVEPIAFEP